MIASDAYIERERRIERGPLIQIKYGGRFRREYKHRFLAGVAAYANAELSADEQTIHRLGFRRVL